VVPVTALWLPILLSAVIVFVASSIIHMLLPYHRSDYKKLPSEDGIMDALRPFNIPPGDYVMPLARTPSEVKDPAFVARHKRGPNGFLTFTTSEFSMGTTFAQWFIYTIIVSIFAAYIAGAALAPGTDYLEVFRFAGTTAFAAYTLGLWQYVIWYRRSGVTAMKSTFDGLVYALLTAGTIAWLWPR
jgi:hypothetical protein